MAAEIGSGQVAIFPVFRGFRSAVTKETDGAAKASASGFNRVFGKTGAKVGQAQGRGFKGAFDSSIKGFGSASLKQFTADVARESRAVQAARLKEQDVAGKVRVAEAQLAEARRKGASGSSQVVRAEERLAAAQRAVGAAQDTTRGSSERLRTAQARLKDATDQAASSTGRADGGFRRFGSGSVRVFGSISSAAKGVAKIVGTGLGFGLAASAVGLLTGAVSRSVGVIKSSITAASNLQQSVGGVTAVFGKSSGVINRWARGAASSVGLSQNAYNQFAAVVGSQLKGAGVPMDQLAGKTKQLITLGADLAATYGGTTSDAVDALGASLRGEFDPLERFGVSLNQAAINAKGVSLGFDLVSGSLSTQGKQAATLALIYDRTRDAQGQFSKQTGTLAEQQQILGAQLDNVKAKLGTAFLPAVSAVVGALSTSLGPALTKLQPVFDGIGRSATSLAPQLSTGLVAVFGKIASVAAVLGPALLSAGQSLGPVFGSALTTLTPVLAQVVPQLAAMATQVLPSLTQVILALAPLIPPLASIISSLAPMISAIATGLSFLTTSVLAPLLTQLGLGAQAFRALGGGMSLAQFTAKAAQGSFGTMLKTAVDMGHGVTAASQSFFVFVRNAGAGLGQFVGVVRSKIGEAVTAIRTKIGEAVAIVRGLPGRAVGALGDIGSRLFSSGAALIGGFINGIRSKIREIQSAVGDAMAAAGKFLPHSPAKLGEFSGRGWTLYSGQATAEGFADGIDSRVSRIQSSAAAAMKAASVYSSAGLVASSSSTGGAGYGDVRVEILNKTGINLTDLIDVRVTRGIDAQNRAIDMSRRMGDRKIKR